MFTGIVLEVGSLAGREASAGGLKLNISSIKVAPNLRIGDSVACNGVCLTATEVRPNGFSAFAVSETLSKTTLGSLKLGAALNLEPALTPSTPLGGHYVMGHVDGVAEVADIRPQTEGSGDAGIYLTVRIPKEFTKYCIPKGSFAINGVSLTIASLKEELVTFALIPHTLSQTNLSDCHKGSMLNFEVDLMGKYVERLLGAYPKPDSGLDAGQLEKWGYGV